MPNVDTVSEIVSEVNSAGAIGMNGDNGEGTRKGRLEFVAV